MGNHQAAIQDYSNAIELQPNDGANFAARGQVHFQMGDYPAALQDYNRAIELNPKNQEYPKWIEQIISEIKNRGQ